MSFTPTDYLPYDFANRRHIGPSPSEMSQMLEVLGADEEVLLAGEGQCAWAQGWPAEKIELTTDHIEAEVQALRLTLDLVDERGRTS